MGSVDVKSNSGVYFYLQRITEFASSSSQTVIPYEREILNIGNAINLASGVFTAPTNGLYHFTFTGLAGADRSFVQLRLNGVNIAYSTGWLQFDLMPITATLQLKRVDRVDTYLYGGSLDDYTQFSGVLLQEDLVF